jgi:hypothetical protein
MIPKAKSTIQRGTCKRQESSQKGSEEGSKCQQSQMLGFTVKQGHWQHKIQTPQ